MAVSRLGPIYDPLRNRGVPAFPFIYIGFVKRNDDMQRMGRLSVWIPEMGGTPDDESAWVIASYASPFAGASDINSIDGYTSNPQVAQQSYGLWLVPPDLNNEVAVFFANGDVSRAYWFACTYQQNMNKMVPGIAVDVTTEPSPPIHISPVIEYNKSDPNISADDPRRPPFQPLRDGLITEGLRTDNERGSASTSARREAPSQVFGLLSPRGNTVHIDDSTQNEFIRLRTRSGAQVLINETTGYVYINSKNGNSWLEISDAGIDCYTSNSISMRAQGDLNVRADRDILLDAGANIRMHAGADITMASGGSIQEQATGKINLNASSNIELTTSASILTAAAVNSEVKTGGDLVMSIGNDIQTKAANDWIISVGHDIQTDVTNNWVLSVGQAGSLKLGSSFDLNADTQLNLQSGGNLNINSGFGLYLESEKDTSLKAGGKQIRDGSAILDNRGAASHANVATANQATAPIATIALIPPVLPPALVLGDAKQKVVDNITIWQGNAGQITAIVHRMPTHEPWRDHPNANVPPPPTDCVEINAAGTFGTGSSSNINPDGTLNDTGCSTGVGGTKSISTEVYNAIMHACTKTGADPATMLAFADMESSFQPGIAAKSSSATGLYQFTKGTWDSMVTKYGNQYNVGYNQINDASSNALMGGQFMNDNVAILKRNGISNPTPGQIYIMHFGGSSGGLKIISASQQTPNADASLTFPEAARANPRIFQGKTCAQVAANLGAMADAKAKAYSGQYGLPAPCDRTASGSPATPLNPTATAAAEMTAPKPIDMNTKPSGSVTLGEGRPPPPPAPEPDVPVGGTGQVCQAGTNPLQAGANGFVGPNSSPASLLAALGVTNTSQWRKGSTDPTTWSKNQPIAIFNADGSYSSAHAAIFLGIVQTGNPDYNGVAGLLVYDQSPGEPAKQRIIPFDVANPNNATLYAAVNIPGGVGGGSGTGGMEPNLPPNAKDADKVRAACISAYPAHTGDCSGFVKAVSRILQVNINQGNADAITASLSGGGGWTVLSGGTAAAAAAAAGQLVVGGLIGSQQASPNHHGHVVVVVAGPVVRGSIPTAYWGALGGTPGAYQTLNYAWTAADLPKITYAAMTVPGGTVQT